jgi:hypothetical protein
MVYRPRQRPGPVSRPQMHDPSLQVVCIPRAGHYAPCYDFGQAVWDVDSTATSDAECAAGAAERNG